MLDALNSGPAEKVMVHQAAQSTCRCSLEEGPHFGSSESHVKSLETGSPIPRIGCRRFILLQTLPRLYTLPLCRQCTHLTFSAKFCGSKTILCGWNSHCTASGSFHMPLLCEVSQTEVPAKNFPAHFKKGPISEVLSLTSNRWRHVFSFRSPIPRTGCKPFIVPQILP